MLPPPCPRAGRGRRDANGPEQGFSTPVGGNTWMMMKTPPSLPNDRAPGALLSGCETAVAPTATAAGGGQPAPENNSGFGIGPSEETRRRS